MTRLIPCEWLGEDGGEMWEGRGNQAVVNFESAQESPYVVKFGGVEKTLCVYVMYVCNFLGDGNGWR